TTYYHNDHLGNPVAATDERGDLLWRAHFTPYGERHENPTDNAFGTVGYTGHAQDKASGLVYMGARYYDPVIGRFMAVDPVGFISSNPMSFNRYSYANNNSYKYFDPDGRYLESAWDAASLTLGLMSLKDNVSNGNWGAAALDTVGVLADGAAIAVPVVPGGAGALIGVSRKGTEALSSEANKLYHYTDEQGAKAIAETGVIKPDDQGRVFVTTDKVSSSDASNALFMGRGGSKGTYRVEITPVDNLPLNGGTQPNELIHFGSIRDGRQGALVKVNDF
ncbi:RHS repeat-associated core domain-containing protein, partial [Pseudomonas indica]|uniref:RHS repeat-associated core domain-containing protein n=1 Tax=Pseudomonas indica TaxID=137658 RepID=UPI000BAB838B